MLGRHRLIARPLPSTTSDLQSSLGALRAQKVDAAIEK